MRSNGGRYSVPPTQKNAPGRRMRSDIQLSEGDHTKLSQTETGAKLDEMHHDIKEMLIGSGAIIYLASH